MTRTRARVLTVLIGTLAVASSTRYGLATADDPLAATFAKMDAFAAKLRTLKAGFKQLEHLDAIHEDDVDTGTLQVKRGASKKDLRARFEFDPPNPKLAVADSSTVQIYYPNNPGEIQKVELGKQKSLVDAFLALGFGGDSKELQKAYTVTAGGSEVISGEKTMRLDLTPKSHDMQETFVRIELWISEEHGYAVQQKFYEKGRNYKLVTYHDVVPNPNLPDSVFKLEVPKGTKKETVVKK